MTALLLPPGGSPVATIDVGVRGVAASGDTTGGTDTAALNAAITELHAAGGGTVFVAPGQWWNSPIVMRSSVRVIGTGGSQDSPTAHLVAGADCNMIEYADATMGSYLGHMTLDGHRENQSSGAGVTTETQQAGPDQAFGNCAVNVLERVTTQYTHDEGIIFSGIENRALGCYVFSSGGDGFIMRGSDMFIHDLTVGESGGHGVILESVSSTRIDLVKSWWAGRNGARGTNPSTAGNGSAAGFIFSGSGIMATNLEAQDCSGPGAILGVQGSQISMNVDANGFGAGADGFNALIDGCRDALLNLTSSHTSGHYATPYPLKITAGTTRTTITMRAAVDAAMHPDSLASGSSNDATNKVTLNGTAY